ncbi:hypothetical protein ACLESD_38330 [Pyxidicoccus sp. 3LFB2]
MTRYPPHLLLFALLVAALPAASEAFSRNTTPCAYDAALPPINEGALMLQGRSYRAVAGQNNTHFIEGRRLNRLLAGSPGKVETAFPVLESYWAPISEGYLDASGVAVGPGAPCRARWFSEQKSFKVVRAYEFDKARYTAVLTRDGRVFLLPWNACPDSPTGFCGFSSPQQLDDGVGHLTFDVAWLPVGTPMLLYVKADGRLIETKLSATAPQVLSTRTYMWLPPQIHNPKITHFYINPSTGFEYSACGIDPALNVYCTGVLRTKETAAYSGTSRSVTERTTAAVHVGSNLVHYKPAQSSILGNAMDVWGRWYNVGSGEVHDGPNGSSVQNYDIRPLTHTRNVTDLRQPDEDFATASRPGVAVAYSRYGSMLFAVSPDRLLHARYFGPSYGWYGDEPSYLMSKPSIAIRRDASVSGYEGDVFYLGKDRGLYWATRAGSTSSTVALGGVGLGTPSAVSWGGNRLDVFKRGTDNGLWHRWTDDTVNWGGWEWLAGNVGGDPVAVSWGWGRLDIFYRGTDNALWQVWWDGAWRSRSFGGYVVGEPAVVSRFPGNLEVFYRGADNALYHGWSHGGTNEIHWESLGGYITASPVAVARTQGVDVYVRGSDGALWRAAWEGAGWFWDFRGGYIQEGPFAAATSFNGSTTEVYYKGADRNLWRHGWNNGWSSENLGLFE